MARTRRRRKHRKLRVLAVLFGLFLASPLILTFVIAAGIEIRAHLAEALVLLAVTTAAVTVSLVTIHSMEKLPR